MPRSLRPCRRATAPAWRRWGAYNVLRARSQSGSTRLRGSYQAARPTRGISLRSLHRLPHHPRQPRALYALSADATPRRHAVGGAARNVYPESARGATLHVRHAATSCAVISSAPRAEHLSTVTSTVMSVGAPRALLMPIRHRAMPEAMGRVLYALSTRTERLHSSEVQPPGYPSVSRASRLEHPSTATSTAASCTSLCAIRQCRTMAPCYRWSGVQSAPRDRSQSGSSRPTCSRQAALSSRAHLAPSRRQQLHRE